MLYRKLVKDLNSSLAILMNDLERAEKSKLMFDLGEASGLLNAAAIFGMDSKELDHYEQIIYALDELIKMK